MKTINKLFTITIVISLVILQSINAQEDSTNKRSNLLQRRPAVGGRGQGIFGKGSTTTTTTTELPQEQNEEYEDGEEGENGGNGGDGGDDEFNQDSSDNQLASSSSTTTTSTEPPKKIGPILRPFRSNDDLLNALRRRRQETMKTINKKPIKKVIDESGDGEKSGENFENQENVKSSAAVAAPVKNTGTIDRSTRKRFGSGGSNSYQQRSSSAAAQPAAAAAQPAAVDSESQNESENLSQAAAPITRTTGGRSRFALNRNNN